MGVFVIPDSAANVWTPLTYVNGWTDFGSGYAPGSYMKDAFNIVWLRGLIAGGTTYTITTLPAGFRPTSSISLIIAVAVSTVYKGVDMWVTPAGVLQAPGLSTFPVTWLSLEGVSFPV